MALQCLIDGADTTSITLDGSTTHQHNRPSFVTVRQPSALTPITETSRCKVVLDGTLDFHGLLTHLEDVGETYAMYTQATFADPTLLFEMRPCRDGPGSGDKGDFSKPSFMQRNTTAPQMLQEILQQSLDGSDPADGEGPMGITLGSFATGGVNLSGAPTDWPMTISQWIALMTETGELDVVNTPIDVGGNMGQVSAYNGDFGSNLTGSVRFEYGVGLFNASAARRTLDLRGLVNKLWIYGGPRKGTKNDPAGDQHWAFNITGDRLEGAPNVPPGTGLPDPPQSAIAAAIADSRARFFTRMAIRIFDGDETDNLLSVYLRWWQMESWLRAKPQTLVHVTPDPGIKPAFRTGDLIHTAATTQLRGGWSGTQRVMEYSYRWDETGVVRIAEPITQPGVVAPAIALTADTEGI